MKYLTLSLFGCIPAILLAAASTSLAQAPANDNFAAATPVTAGVVTAGTNVNATVEAGEPPTHWTLTYAAGAATGKSVWFSYTPAASGLASFTVVAQGTGTTAVIMQGAAYSGTALANLVRIASASSTAGAAGPPATAGVAFPSNLFAVTAGVPVYIQVTGASATGVAPFNLTVSSFGRTGSVVLPRYSDWEWLHTTTGANPTDAATWATTWKFVGDTTDYGTAPAVIKFSAPQPAPLGFAAMDGGPGVKTDIGTAAAANNNAGYARTAFTLANDTSNLWAEVVADDGAYIYIDGFPGIPVHIASRLSEGSFTTSTGFYDFRPQADVHITGAIPAAAAGAVPGCRAFVPAGFNAERSTKMVYLSGLVGQLSAGSHQIAVSLHQTGTASSDMAFDLQLLDMGAWPLASGDAGITFTDVPYVPASGTTAVIPALEHHFASAAGQTDLAWFCVAPDSSVAQGYVTADSIAGAQKALRWNAANGQRFVTEPVKVDGLAAFAASLRIRTNDTSSGFEDPDGFRVFLETSEDGINFSEPVSPLEVQPQLNGAAAYTPFSAAFLTKSLSVSPNPYKYVRMVITGGVDSDSESIYFDDVLFSQTAPIAIGTIAVSNPVRSPGADLSTTADDTFTYTLLVDGTPAAAAYEIRSSDVGNTVLYGTGVYGVTGTVTIPAGVTSLTIKDGSVPPLLKAAALPPPGADLAMGRTVINGTNLILYNNPAATAVNTKWTQTTGTGITPLPGDLELTVTETTTQLHPAAALAANEGILESPSVTVAGIANVVVSASLRAYEASAGTGFEVTDTFKIEVLEDRGGAVDDIANLITGQLADDSPVNDLFNGFTGTVAAYDANPAQDEFNAAGALSGGNSRGTFVFSYTVPADVLRIRVRITGANDSANEYFFLQNLIITNDANLDSDGDGLADAWETLYFGNLSQTAAGDSDGDGQTNSSEQAAGTAPNDGTSALAITTVAKAGNLADLTFNSIAGKKYIAQSAAGVSGWLDTGSEVTATGPTTTITGVSGGAGDKFFFRIRLVP